MAQRFAILESGAGWQIWRVCLDDVGRGCPRAVDCHCQRTDQGPLRTLLGTYRSERQALQAVIPLQEAWGEAPGDPRPAAWEGRKGDGYRYPVQGSLFIDEPEVPF